MENVNRIPTTQAVEATVNSNLTMTPTTTAPTTTLGYLERAATRLRELGVPIPAPEANQITIIAKQVESLDPEQALIIAQTLQQATVFNSMARDQIKQINFGTRYEEITSLFDTIQEDAKAMVQQLEDGKIDWKEKASNAITKLRRGTIQTRYDKISKVYKSVTNDTADQLRRESIIIEAYLDFRGALKSAEGATRKLMAQQTGVLDKAKVEFTNSVEKANEAGLADEEKSARQLVRDELQRKMNVEDRKYQVLKNLVDNFSVAYNVGETVVAKLQQTHSCKQAVFDQAVTFFATNEHVFTALAATFSGEQGLHEATKAVDALKSGVNRSLETLAEVTGKTGEAAIRTAYGATVSASSVQKLVNAIVDFQVNSTKLIAEMRTQATENAKEIERIVDDGKQRQAAAIVAAAQPVKA